MVHEDKIDRIMTWVWWVAVGVIGAFAFVLIVLALTLGIKNTIYRIKHVNPEICRVEKPLNR